MQNHGLVAGGKTLKEVFLPSGEYSSLCKTYFAAKFLGKIHKLNKDEIKNQ